MSARMLLKLHSRRDAVPQCLRRFPASLQHLPIEQREPALQPWFRLQEGSQPPSHTCVRTSPEGAAGHSACRCPRNHPGTRVKDPCQDRHPGSVSYTHLRAHETKANLVCRLLLETKKKKIANNTSLPLLSYKTTTQNNTHTPT